jgi:hypothetical protein
LAFPFTHPIFQVTRFFTQAVTLQGKGLSLSFTCHTLAHLFMSRLRHYLFYKTFPKPGSLPVTLLICYGVFFIPPSTLILPYDVQTISLYALELSKDFKNPWEYSAMLNFQK